MDSLKDHFFLALLKLSVKAGSTTLMKLKVVSKLKNLVQMKKYNSRIYACLINFLNDDYR